MSSRLRSRVILAIAATLTVSLVPVVNWPAEAAHPVTPTVDQVPLTAADTERAAALKQVASGEKVTALTAEQSTSDFDLVAVTWDRDAASQVSADTAVSVRLHENGSWGQWYDLDVAEGEGPDPDTAEGKASRPGTNPLLTDGADGYQLKVTGGPVPAGARVELVDAGRSEADAAAPMPAATAHGAVRQPNIITRAQWGADESLRDGSPSYSKELRVGVVHHTESTNDYTADNAAAQMRAIYAFHTRSRGWSDIGYNFLVDKFGRVYEGRYGGVDKAVIGAHAGGYNSNTFGVSVLGSYMSTDVPPAVLNGLNSIMSWKMATNYIDPTGRSLLTSAGGGTALYPGGDTRYFNNLLGHRNTGSTDCPGDKLYAQLPTLRAMLKSSVGAGLAKPSITVGSHYVEVRGGAVNPLDFTATVTDASGALVRRYSAAAGTSFAASFPLTGPTGRPLPDGDYNLTVTNSNASGPGVTWSGTFTVVKGRVCATRPA